MSIKQEIEDMEIEIIAFGKISEFVTNQRLSAPVGTTDDLKAFLEESFPELKAMKYKLALNRNIVQENSGLSDHDTVAIMPPFSGG